MIVSCLEAGPARSDVGGVVQAPDFAAFFAVSLDLMVIRDRAGRIVKVNPAWEAVLGWGVDELEGQPMLDFIHPDDLCASRDRMRSADAGGDVDTFVNRYRCRDGGYRHFEWRARQEGDIVYGVARDVTERIALDADMAEARSAAEAANLAKSEFLANMSHEIRTPLNGVIGVAGALARTGLSPRQAEMVEVILTSGQTLERVVSDVLDISKIEAGRLEFEAQPFDLRAQLDGVLDLFRPRAAEKGLRLTVAYGPDAQGWFCGDAVRVKQLLGNLVSNAVKFTAVGEIEVTVGVGDTDERGPAVLTIAVRDTGIGFDAAAGRKLFQRFSQADGSVTRRFGGTGLGLSICQALAGMMGGEVCATSQPGRGSCFTLTIPLPRHILRQPDLPAAGPIAAPERSPGLGEGIHAGRPVHVLLAEDHVVNQRVVELILGPSGIVLTKVENGADALGACMTGTYDLVLMDMQMPVMDGLAATRAIRAFESSRPDRPRTPIIMLSANAMRQHGEDALAAGADLHLPKPVTPAALLGAIARTLQGDDGD